MDTEKPEPTPISEEFRAVFRELVKTTQARHVRTDPDVLRAYFEVLSEFSADVLRESARQLQRTRTFFPSSGEWFQAAKTLTNSRRERSQPSVVVAAPVTPSSLGAPNDRGEWPYDPTETFTADELRDAQWWLDKADGCCPHSRPCATVQDCVEDMAWYLRHRRELHVALGWTP